MSELPASAVNEASLGREQKPSLRRLCDDLAALRRALADLRAETQSLLARERQRPLTPEEAQRARRLSEETHRLRQTFERLRDELRLLRSAKE